MIDHDRLFKELITTFFAEFVGLLLPEMSTYLEAGSIEFLDKEVFTDVTEGERYEADVVARARFKGTASCFLVHVENQAQSHAEFGRRMFRYFARLHEKYVIPVYPVVIFSHDPARMKLISGFIDTYLRLDRDEALQFAREADTVLTVNERSKMLELTTSWKEEGRWDECRRVVQRLLTHRFGPLESSVETRIGSLSLERLEALAEALLDFRSAEEIHLWLAAVD